MYIVTKRAIAVAAGGLLAGCLLAGCAAQKGAFWGDPESGLILEYRMPGGEALSYRMTSDFTQTMEIIGRRIDIESEQILAFSAASRGGEGGDNRLTVTIDDLRMRMVSPEGELIPETGAVLGKSFEMTLSPHGEERDLPDPTTIMYDAGPEGQRSIIPSFAAMFPDLPGRPVVVGDSWPSSVEIKEDVGAGTALIKIDAVNTLAGFETIDGVECARVEYTFGGTIEASGEQQGAPWESDATMDGTGTWYFAYQEGHFVSDASTGTADGDIVVGPPGQTMAVPMSREFRMTTGLTR